MGAIKRKLKRCVAFLRGGVCVCANGEKKEENDAGFF